VVIFGAMENTLSQKLMRYIEGVRIAEGMSKRDFVAHFDISVMTYYRWCKGRVPPTIRAIENGLNSLGYNAYIIIDKSNEDSISGKR